MYSTRAVFQLPLTLFSSNNLNILCFNQLSVLRFDNHIIGLNEDMSDRVIQRGGDYVQIPL